MKRKQNIYNELSRLDQAYHDVIDFENNKEPSRKLTGNFVRSIVEELYSSTIDLTKEFNI